MSHGKRSLRATGEHVETFAAAVHDVLQMNYEVRNNVEAGLEDIFHVPEGAGESMSIFHTPSSTPTTATKAKSKKRKQINEGDDLIVGAINNLADITKDTMSDLIKELASDSNRSDLKRSTATDSVLDALGKIPELTSNEKVRVAELLVDNPNKLALFPRLGHENRLSLKQDAPQSIKTNGICFWIF